MRVVTLTGFTPPPRYDGLKFTNVVVEEGSSDLGPWTQLADIVLSPVEPDPQYPLTRDVTVENATLANGWYRVTFKDATGDVTAPTAPVQNIVPLWTPSLTEIGSLLRTRTVNVSGDELGTFTGQTRPKSTEVLSLINQAVRDVSLKIGQLNLTEAYVDDARQLAALRTAMLIELSYFPEQVGSNRSPYAQYKALYDEGIASLIEDLTVVVGETAGTAGTPQFSFPLAEDVMVGYTTDM